MATKTFPVVLLSLALAVAGCGGGNSNSESKKPSKSDSSSGPTATPSTNPADQAIAEGSVLTLGDFRSGWEAKAADNDDESASDHRIAKCAGFDYDSYYGSNTGDAYSKDFTSSDDETISNEVTIQADEALSTTNFATSRTEKFRGCFEAEAQRRIEDGAKGEKNFKVGKASLNELSFDHFGDESFAYRLTIPVTTEGTDVDVYGEYIVIRVGRAQTVVIAQSTFSPFDADELAKLAKAATDRLTAQLNGTAS